MTDTECNCRGMYAYNKDRLCNGYRELRSNLLKDIPFDAVAFSVIKVNGMFSCDEREMEVMRYEEKKPGWGG